jgi:hypothetical protein
MNRILKEQNDNDWPTPYPVNPVILSKSLFGCGLPRCGLCESARESPDWRAEAQRTQRKRKTTEAGETLMIQNID